MNREERRHAAKIAQQTGGPMPPTAQEEQLQRGAAALMETIVVNRMDAVGIVLNTLFTQDPGDGIFRLQGLGGPTGTITVEALNKVAAEAAQGRTLLPQQPGQEVETENEGGQENGGAESGIIVP
jgi:hypothetical protein